MVEWCITIGGILFIAIGVLVLVYGGKKLKLHEGNFGKMILGSEGAKSYATAWKWAVGILSLLIGMGLVFRGF